MMNSLISLLHALGYPHSLFFILSSTFVLPPSSFLPIFTFTLDLSPSPAIEKLAANQPARLFNLISRPGPRTLAIYQSLIPYA